MPRTAEAVSLTDIFVKRLHNSQERHLQKTRDLRRQIMAAEGMEPLDQAVLGMTGSSEELSKYRTIAQKIGQRAGQSLVVIEAMGPNNRLDSTWMIDKAKAGLVAGPLNVKIEPSFPHWRADDSRSWKQDEPHNYHTSLQVPVRPILSYVRRAESDYGRQGREFYFDEATTGRQGEEGGLVDIAEFTWNPNFNEGLDPEDDVQNDIPFENVLIDHEAMYGHELFQFGIGKILLALEEHVGGASPKHEPK